MRFEYGFHTRCCGNDLGGTRCEGGVEVEVRVGVVGFGGLVSHAEEKSQCTAESKSYFVTRQLKDLPGCQPALASSQGGTGEELI